MDLCQTHCRQVPDFSRGLGHVVWFQLLPTGQHGLCFGYCFSGPLPLRSLINGPPIGVRFQESLVIRLYSEIRQIHLSIEAQCDIILLPLGDCHTIPESHGTSVTHAYWSVYVCLAGIKECLHLRDH